MLSALVSHENKLDMVHIQNSTLAGGVAVGSVCNLLIQPYAALTIGVLAGLLSVLGYRYLSVRTMNAWVRIQGMNVPNNDLSSSQCCSQSSD